MRGKFYFFHQFFSMRKILSSLVIASFAITSLAFAADSTVVVSPNGVTTSTSSGVDSTTAVVAGPNGVTTSTTGGDPTITMNAATTISASAGSAIGEYKAVACSSNALFGSNSCDQCFDGSSVKVGEALTGLFDNWTNATTNILTAYKEEQKTPNMVRVGATIWTATPADETKLWKYSSDIVWTQSGTGGKSQYILIGGQKVKFFEADLGAKYTLDKTDKKNGDTVGILRFPVVSHVVDASGNDGAANTHYECVAYKLNAPAVAPVTLAKPAPAKITETKTGPETLILIIAAFFIAFGLMFSLRKRM